MKNHLIKKFGVSEKGAKNLIKGIKSSFLLYFINMSPVILIMLLSEKLLYNKNYSKALIITLSIISLALLFIILMMEYESLYNTTYKESANLRVEIANKLKNLPLFYFTKKDLTDLSQTIMSDVESLEHAMSHAISKVYAMYFFLPFMLIFLLLGNVKMALAIIIPNACRFLVLLIFKNNNLKANKKYYDIKRENSKKLQEIIELHKEINGFNMNEKTKKSMYDFLDYSEKIHFDSEKSVVGIVSLSKLFSFVSLGIVLFVASDLIIKNEINLLYLLGYILASFKIKDLSDVSNQEILELFYIDEYVKKIKEIKNEALQEGIDYELKNFDVELENVSFSYGDKKVLDKISFIAKQNEITALVGPSGCGKSTILKLVSRLYDYDGGIIKIDSKDIKNISTRSLFDNISIVFQDVILFNQSIYENIRIGNLNANKDQIIKAAKDANCLEFIEKLPDGFNTIVGENGAKLSGGQRQRISIARAFLKNAPILILDEISSNLDIENETKIQQSLNKLIENKTVIVISHRIKSIEKADKIVVINDKKIEAIGDNNYLLNNSKTYKKLVDQSKLAENFKY
ncbi:MAG: ABC transporter ATP-binding protein [Tissierellia bacterium]|nr:ABC transporter ATP-binding protein [Tissierellia bacterium]